MSSHETSLRVSVRSTSSAADTTPTMERHFRRKNERGDMFTATAESSEACGSATDRERAAGSSNDGRGRCPSVSCGRKWKKTRQMERESISMHCALQQWTVKGTDCRHQPSAQDMDAKPVATRPEARVAAQTQGWFLGNRIWQPLGDLCAGPWDQKNQQQRGDGRPVVAVTACYALGPLGRVLAEHLGSTSRQRDDFF